MGGDDLSVGNRERAVPLNLVVFRNGTSAPIGGVIRSAGESASASTGDGDA
jgi:hypothetical protein